MIAFWILIAILSKIIHVENKMIPLKYITINPIVEEIATPPNDSIEDNPFDRVIGLPDFRRSQKDAYALEAKQINSEKTTKRCSVVVLSNAQNPSMQSLLRKYKYDANGILIPSSVKYFMKLPQGFGVAPVLVPLNDKAFSPLGGFVRYYKEVPPIPQSW